MLAAIGIIAALATASGDGFYAERDPTGGREYLFVKELDVAAAPGGLVDIVLTAAILHPTDAVRPDLYHARSRDHGHSWQLQTGFVDTTNGTRVYDPLIETGEAETCLIWSELRPSTPEDLFRLMVAYVMPDGRVTAPVRLDDGSHTALISVIHLHRTAMGYQVVYRAGNSRWHVLAGDRLGGWGPVERVVPDSVRVGAFWASPRGPSVAASAGSTGVDVWTAEHPGAAWKGPHRIPNTHGEHEPLRGIRVAEADGTLAVVTQVVTPQAASLELRSSTDGGATWTAPHMIAQTNAFGTPSLADLDVEGGGWHVTYIWWFGPFRVDLHWVSSDGRGNWSEPRRVNTERGMVTESYISSLDVHDDDAYVGWVRQAPTFAQSARFRSTSPSSVPGLDTRALLLANTVPNPVVTRGARLTIDLLEPASIVVELYSVGGRLELRRTLGPLDTGRYTMDWDGLSAQRRKLRSGVYFWNVEATRAGVTSATAERFVVRD